MQLDVRSLSSAKTLESDVCVVGAGPAGLIVGLELAGCGIDVVVLESGGTDADPTVQDLNDGQVIGASYAGLRATRHRALGGTAAVWNTAFGAGTGAKYVPLDPWDFDPRRDATLPGWPLDYTTLQPYYERAQAGCGLGAFSYEAHDGESPVWRAWSFDETAMLCSRIYRFGRATPFTADKVSALQAAANVLVCEHATVMRLVPGPGQRVAHVEARATPTGPALTVAARFFVLAGGAIENARLLLASSELAAKGLIAGQRCVGLGFMEHPRDWSLRLIPRSKDALRGAGFYDARTDGAGLTLCGRLALSPNHPARMEMPNFSITLLPHIPPSSRLTRSLRRLGWIRDRRGYGWSQRSGPATFFDRFQLVINLEQRPRPENRVVLARDVDALGIPRAELHWQWTAEEQAEWERTRARIAEEIEAAGLGRIEQAGNERPDPNAHHHSGTTRMADDPTWGVVNRDCRVHGATNLYVTGASTFPTAGYANPTLTIVALAIRLADHLAAAVRSESLRDSST